MFRVTFDKSTCEQFLENLAGRQAIVPRADGRGWLESDLLILAAACQLTVLNRACREPASIQQWTKDSTEYREARADTLVDDVRAAVDFCLTLTGRVFHGHYDDRYEPCVEADVGQVEGCVSIMPQSGFKGTDSAEGPRGRH